jgi:hypothetical protein
MTGGIILIYIHFNPVKHGYVSVSQDWLYSSYHQAVRNGWYDSDIIFGNDFKDIDYE